MIIEITSYVTRVRVDDGPWQNLDDFEGEIPLCSYVRRFPQTIEFDLEAVREAAEEGDELAQQILERFKDEIEQQVKEYNEVCGLQV